MATIEDRVVALETTFNVLLASLGDAGSLPRDTFLRNLCRATNQLAESGLAPGAVVLMDQNRPCQLALFPEDRGSTRGGS